MLTTILNGLAILILLYFAVIWTRISRDLKQANTHLDRLEQDMKVTKARY